MTRDVLINAHPINWIGDINYIWTILTAVVVTFLFRSKIAPLRKTMFLFDTIGISVFTLIGVQKGLSFDLHPFVALVMGMSSAVMGGVIRDVLTNEIPLIFHREIYASACLAGGMVYLLLHPFNINEDFLFVISAAIIVTVRTIAVQYKLELPRIKKDVFGK